MSQSNSRPITDQEVSNTRHVLNLLRNQIKTGRVDGDYLLRQFDKFEDMLDRVGDMQANRLAGGRFEALYNVSRVLGTSLDEQTVLDQVIDAVLKLTGAERGLLMLRDDDGELRVKAARNIDQQTLTSEQFQYSRTIANQVLDEGKTLLTTNALEDPRFSGQQSIINQSLRSIMAAPLRARGNIIGVAYVENRIIAGLFSDEDVTTLETLAGQAAVAIDNAILFSDTDEELNHRLEELRQLRRIDLQLNEQLDPNSAILMTLEWACRLSGAMVAYLGTVSEDKIFAQVYDTRLDTQVNDDVLLNKLFPQVDTVIKTVKPLRLTANDLDNVASNTTVLILPIIREKQAIGVMALRRDDDDDFSDEQTDLLERLVNRSTVTIENARLYAAVQAADKAKSEFVGIVAHDLKTPMTSIRGYAELLLMQFADLDERKKQFLERISNTVVRMEVLVSDLADISRIESGQFYMNEIHTTVTEVVQAIKDTTLPQMTERNHNYVEDVEDDLPELYVDYYRLVQVLTNLVSNAYKYTPDGGTITVTIKRDSDRVAFTVADTGIGLSEEGVAKLGTKFWRAKDEYTRSQEGTGLGFAITAGLIQQMGSDVKITSELGKGSQFSFSVAIATGND